jgi:hypothetical protein
MSGSQVDVEAAIRLLQEVKKSASPEDLAAIREALEPTTDAMMDATTDAATSTTSSGVSRRTSGVSSSLSSLMRRRSMVQTPGVATRSSPVDNRRTWNSWRTPQLNAEQEAKWRTPAKQTSVGNLAVPDLAEDARAQTPGSLDYSHLGTYRPGTLMVTNGPPSPAASSVHISRHNSSMDDSNDNDNDDNYDYFASGGGHFTTARTSRNQSHARSQSSNAPEAAYPSQLNKHRRSMVETRSTALSESNRVFTSAQQPPSIDTSRQNATAFVPEYQAYTPPIDTSMQNATAFAHEYQAYSSPVDTSMQSATALAHEYQAYIPPSPFGNQVEFHTEANETQTEVYEEKQVYQEPEQELHSNVYELPANRSETPDVCAGVHAKLSEQLIYGPRGRPAPRTTDSGYSSLGSLRRVATESPNANAATTASTSASSPHAMFSDSRQQTGSFELPIQGTQVSELNNLLLATVPAQKVQTHPAPLVIPTRDSTSDTILSPQSASLADSPRTRTQKRLQRRRPSQTGPPVVQSCQPVQDMSVPEVPDDVRVKFTRRLSSTPGMECLTQTYPIKEHEFASDSLGDVTAVASSDESAAPSPPVDFERPRTPPVRTRRKSLSLFHRRSTAEKMAAEEELPSPEVLDLGTIAAVLGSSPYDPAMMNTAKREAVASPTHPHQLGQLTRPKSIARMSSNAAAELARLRSKDRAMGESEMARDQHHRKPRGDAGEARAARRRLHGFYFDEAPPPVPAIDTNRFPGLQVAQPQPQLQTQPQAELEAAPVAQSSIDWDAHSRHWRQRRKSIGEGLREHAQPQVPPFKARPMSYVGGNEAAGWGRYSGGLEYEYGGRGYGVGGSAGTRQMDSYASVKSQHWKQDYGVDLSDVPVILQRV